MSPFNHACQAYDINYSDSLCVCTVCGRRWYRESQGWVPSPKVYRKP